MVIIPVNPEASPLMMSLPLALYLPSPAPRLYVREPAPVSVPVNPISLAQLSLPTRETAPLTVTVPVKSC